MNDETVVEGHSVFFHPWPIIPSQQGPRTLHIALDNLDSTWSALKVHYGRWSMTRGCY